MNCLKDPVEVRFQCSNVLPTSFETRFLVFNLAIDLRDLNTQFVRLSSPIRDLSWHLLDSIQQPDSLAHATESCLKASRPLHIFRFHLSPFRIKPRLHL